VPHRDVLELRQRASIRGYVHRDVTRLDDGVRSRTTYTLEMAVNDTDILVACIIALTLLVAVIDRRV